MLGGYFIHNSKAWEHTRMLGYMTYAVHSTENSKPSLTDWMPLLTDAPKEKPAIYTEDEKADLLEMANQRLQMLGKN